MNRKYFNAKFAVIIIILLFPCMGQSEKPNIAVNDLQAQGVESLEAAIITDRLRSEIFRTGAYTVLERGQMQEVLKEQGFQQSGCVSDACVVEVGQLLGVKYMVAGTIGKIGRTYTLNVRLIDVASSKIMGTAVVDCKCDIDDLLSNSTNEIAGKLVKYTGVEVEDKRPAKARPPTVEYGRINIKSEPQGAVVFLNGESMGETPYSNDSLKAGEYDLRLALKGYTAVEEKISVFTDMIFEKTYGLKHSPAYIDSIKALKVANKGPEKKRLWPKVVLGIAAAGACAVGMLLNSQVGISVEVSDRIKGDYEKSGSDADYDSYAESYRSELDNAASKASLRNKFYGLAGACAAVFVITLAF